MRRILALVLGMVCYSATLAAQTQRGKTLDIYVMDVEGGEATLFVSPSGQAMLVDTGWAGFGGRDADRIASVAQQAGVKQIDYLVVTHFHGDHMGGVAQLAARLPVRRFLDHGTTVDQGEQAERSFRAYTEVRSKGSHTDLHPGDPVPIEGVDVRVIASDGVVLTDPLPGAGQPNPLCSTYKLQGPEITNRAGDAEDSRSVSLFISFGQFQTVIMGDLNWNKEFDLMCPRSKLPPIDAYLVSHHGAETSGSEALVHMLRPRVGIMNNGPRKGGAVQTFEILRRSPEFEDLWQNHYSIAGGSQHNQPESFIANLDQGTSATPDAPPVHMGPAHWIKLSAQSDGSFTVTNSRTGQTKSYAPR